MASLTSRAPPLVISEKELKKWGKIWISRKTTSGTSTQPNYFDKKDAMNFGYFIDMSVGISFAKMLGSIPVKKPNMKSLLPLHPDCVEVGPARVIGGIRSQDYDVAYRPDGPRIVFDGKTLNSLKSAGKNWRNMINDISTESSSVHTRFPYCIMGFLLVMPKQALSDKYKVDIIRTLERLGTRKSVLDENHLSEAIAFVVWDPKTGKIDPNIPNSNSNIRIEKFSERVFHRYLERYKGLPPHD